ncbi:MAG: HAMP domain-containing sensor histidine kinase [Elusimicrobia bacterium]|nr:HAMP domain-containing sensor histidine kinase [Elusimicrobiota bacterium]
MRAKYLLFFRAVLAETLLLQSVYAPARSAGPWLPLALLALYGVATAVIFLWERSRGLSAAWLMSSFLFDVVMTSLILYFTGGFGGDFYATYFIVILSTCFIQEAYLSFVVGGVACAVYAAFAFPGLDSAFQPFYLLRLALILVTAFFSAIIADHARQVQRAAAENYEKTLAWLQRLSLVGQALARILHELKTPLGTIRLSSECARRRQGDPGEIGRLLGVIESEADRASAIVANYLDFCRPTELPLRPLPVQEPLARTLEALQTQFEGSEIQVEADLSGRDLVLGSSRHLGQLFAIVFDNAARAMPMGGRLFVVVERSAEEVLVRVRDTGIGLTPETHAHLFDQFSTSRSEHGGTGLGLAIGRWIALKHGGDFSLESPGPARGATALIRLKAAES